MLHGRLILIHLMVAMPLVSMPLVVMVSLGVVDISNVALVAINIVVNCLQSAIRQVDMVTPAGMLAVPLLFMAKLGAVVGIVDIIAILVVDRVVMVMAVIRLSNRTLNDDSKNG